MNIIRANSFKTVPFKKRLIYVIDFLNVFSDHREMKYEKQKINFHDVKHCNKKQDTFDFFDLFFTKYISHMKINKKSNFIFVMKKISNYENTLLQILELYKDIDIRFIIIETVYTFSLNEEILDKNKDDFLCQYILSFLMRNNEKCILISNDKYRDRNLYVDKFNNLQSTTVRILKKSKFNKNIIENQLLKLNSTNENTNESTNESTNETCELQFDNVICNDIYKQIYKRQSIPKNMLDFILNK
jgi:hypothetical protein